MLQITSINQTTKADIWHRADWGDEGRYALCPAHLPTPVIRPSDGRQRGNPCPFLQHQMRLKGWTERETGSHTQQILPHSLQQQQKPSDKVWKLNSTTTFWSERNSLGVLLRGVPCSRAPKGGRYRSLFLPHLHVSCENGVLLVTCLDHC